MSRESPGQLRASALCGRAIPAAESASSTPVERDPTMNPRLAFILVAGCVVGLVLTVANAQNKDVARDRGVPSSWQHLALEHDGGSVTADPELAREIERRDRSWSAMQGTWIIGSALVISADRLHLAPLSTR